MPQLSRRQVLAAGAPLALALSGIGPAWAEDRPAGPALGPPAAFDFGRLKQQAQALAAKPYVAPKPPVPDLVAKIDFDVVQKIRFRPERALWPDGPQPFPIRLFHLDRFNAMPVKIHALSGGMAREVLYSPEDFDYGSTGLAAKLPADLGFSGFRVMNGPQSATDWLAFQGASYFRSAGEDNQYGASARGIAVNTATSTKEEFPRFSAFWLAEPDPRRPTVTIYALLDGPSLTGAYRFEATKAVGAIMDVEANLFIRDDIARLGVAPLTSMYWYGENDRQQATDWRPEIHDSDGLAIWTGRGERIWRPLIDPPTVLTNSFLDDNPRGFGLMQRDRVFADYQDDGAFYNRRPSVWVEPLRGWGPGAVELVEIPTTDEIHDNIVSFWNPKQAIKAGDKLDLLYRLYWQDEEPFPATDVAHVVATRIGRGGIPGQTQPDDKGRWKFVIDFEGGPLPRMAPRYDVKPVVTVSRGKVGNAYVIKVVGTETWRALFDVDAPGTKPIDLRCYLKLGDKTLTGTWLYQYYPPRS